MSMQDPISDMLTRMRNSQAVCKSTVTMPSSKTKVNIAAVLKSEGYITDYSVKEENKKASLTIVLKYFDEQPVISELKRASRPSLRVYKSKDQIPKNLNGLGVAIISTNNGVLSDREARKLGVGGEVLCFVS
jgi:small subunit ribosomal protein S8